MRRRTCAVLLAAVSLSGLAACGGDDDDDTGGFDSEQPSPWFTTVSPSGQTVECFYVRYSTYRDFGWCRDQEQP